MQLKEIGQWARLLQFILLVFTFEAFLVNSGLFLEKEKEMDERDFYYWLQGFFELSGSKELSEEQVQMIKEHMALVAHKVTPTPIEEEPEGEGKRLLTDAAEDPLPRKRCSTTVNTVCASPQFLTC